MKTFSIVMAMVLLGMGPSPSCRAENGKDIRELNQHFNDPDSDPNPWIFTPQSNIKEISTTHSPGLATLYQAGQGQDIKGILKDPIRIDDYPLPWHFHMGLVQNWNAIQGVGSNQQMNFAIGMNVAVTFSDPSTWPQDRTQRPPDTRELQLLVVHLGGTGEFAPGLPQYSDSTHPETFLLYGRGDLGHTAMGDWRYGNIYEGSGRDGGTAAQEIYFTCSVLAPTMLQVNFRSQNKYAGVTRIIDCTKYGPITGIWEIGPIFSCDRWIPDVLCRSIPVERPSIYFAGSSETEYYKPNVVTFQEYDPQPPDPDHEFYLDYCTFVGPEFEQTSDDFNIPGYLENWFFQLPYLVETWSHPGYLTVTTLGQSQWSGFAAATLSVLDLKTNPPPFEVEICLIPPDDSIPWNFHLHQKIFDASGTIVGYWRPGVQNFPEENRARFLNNAFAEDWLLGRKHADWYQWRPLPEEVRQDVGKCVFDLKFPSEPPNEILQHKPLYMLYQVIDPTHLRIGFRANPEDPWFLSEIYDCSAVVDGGISMIQEFCFGSALGKHWGHLPGSPMYQQFRFDYIHFRNGLSPEL